LKKGKIVNNKAGNWTKQSKYVGYDKTNYKNIQPIKDRKEFNGGKVNK